MDVKRSTGPGTAQVKGEAPTVLVSDMKFTDKGSVSVDAKQALNTTRVKEHLEVVKRLRLASTAR